MNVRRGFYLALAGVAGTALFVVYESAPHGLNGDLVIGCSLACGASLVALMADPLIAKWWQNRWGLPYPVAECHRDQGSIVFSLRRLARIEDRVAARVVQPDKSTLEHDLGKAGGDAIETRFPDRFRDGIVLTKGTYRVHWFPIRVRPGSSEYLDVIAKAKIKIKRADSVGDGE